jgi:hypothetical protein
MVEPQVCLTQAPEIIQSAAEQGQRILGGRVLKEAALRQRIPIGRRTIEIVADG